MFVLASAASAHRGSFLHPTADFKQFVGKKVACSQICVGYSVSQVPMRVAFIFLRSLQILAYVWLFHRTTMVQIKVSMQPEEDRNSVCAE